MTSKADLFMATARASDSRRSLLMDRILDDMDAKTRTAVEDTLRDRSVSTARIQAGLGVIGVTVSASAITIWRKRNGV